MPAPPASSSPVYEAGAEGALLFHGQVERLGLEPHLRATGADGKVLGREELAGGYAGP